MDQINELLNADVVCWKCPVVISWYACLSSPWSRVARPIPCSNPSECKRGTTAPVSSMLQEILIHPYLIPNKLPALIGTKWISITRASLNPILSCKNTPLWLATYQLLTSILLHLPWWISPCSTVFVLLLFSSSPFGFVPWSHRLRLSCSYQLYWEKSGVRSSWRSSRREFVAWTRISRSGQTVRQVTPDQRLVILCVCRLWIISTPNRIIHKTAVLKKYSRLRGIKTPYINDENEWVFVKNGESLKKYERKKENKT